VVCTRAVLTRLLLVLSVAVALIVATGCRCERGGHIDPKELRRLNAGAAREPKDPWEAGRLPASLTQGKPREGGRIVVHVFAEPPSLNTIVDSDWWASQITDHRIYQALVSNDPYDPPDYRVVPELAESWEITSDDRVYTFHLRRDVLWHDGRPFTARDVIATFDKVQNEQTKAVHIRAYTKELARYEALDDFTVRFRFEKPYFLALDGIFASIPIQPAHVIESLKPTQYNEAVTNPLNRHPIGTGPFQFVEWASNSKIVLKRFENYWGSKPHVQELVFRTVKDYTVALQLAERQELDVVTVTAQAWKSMKSAVLRRKYHRSKFHDANYAWIGWNLRRPQFRDAVVRSALTMLVDRPGIMGAMLYGLPKPTTCHFYWASDACDDQLAPLPYDPLAAAKLLEHAGWVDRDDDGVRERGKLELRFTLMIPANQEVMVHAATKIKEDMRRAGIDMRLERVEWSAFVRRLRDKDFDACTLAWMGSSRDDPTQIWHSSSIAGGSNYVSFSNPEADRLMDRARVTLNDRRRNKLYRRLGKILYDEQPYTWLWVRPRLTLVHRRLHGVRESLMGWRYEDWWVDGPGARPR
jgi:peptide/nickel transport system substrate-binding protein